MNRRTFFNVWRVLDITLPNICQFIVVRPVRSVTSMMWYTAYRRSVDR